MASFALSSLRALVCAFSLVSCVATVPMASMQDDTHAKLFEKRPDSCGLYIYRDEQFGAANSMAVELDGAPLGTTAAKTFLLAWVQPGKHEIVSRAESDSKLVIEAKAGTLLYVWQEAKMGILAAGCKLHLVSEEQGQKGVHSCELAATAR